MGVSITFLGDSLGDVLGDVLGDLSPAATLLTWADGTFANASTRYIWDATTQTLYGQFAGGAAAIALISDKNRLQMEGARTNLVNEIYDDFDLSGAPTLTSNQPDPTGGTTALKLEGIDAGNSIHDGTTGGTADALCAASTFVKRIDTTSVVAFRNAQTQVLGDWLVDAALLGSEWNRIHSTQAAVSIVSGRVFKNNGVGSGGLWWRGQGGTFEDMYVWYPQYEDDVLFPSSPMNILTTRAADSMSFSAGDVPNAIRSGKWETELTTMHGNADLATSEVMYLYYLDASNYLSLTEDGAGNVQAKLATTSGNIVKTVTYSRDQTVTITPDFDVGELITAGFTTGNGTTLGTVSDWPSSTLHVGSDSTPLNHIFGRMSEPVTRPP